MENKGKDAVVVLWMAIEPVGGYTTESATHGQCDARPTVTFPAIPIYTAWWTEAHCVWTTCPESLREAERPGLEPATSQLQVRHP